MSVSIDFFHYRLESSRFNVRDFEYKEEVRSHINLNIGQNEETTLIRLALRMFHGSPEQEVFFVAYEGAFYITDDNNTQISEDDLQRYGHTTCATMLFPFLCEYIADITRRAGLESINIKPIDFDALYNDNKKQPFS